MDYLSLFRGRLKHVMAEGRYRVFADHTRRRGEFPVAMLTPLDGAGRDVIVWCSNDYLGQGQNPVVLDAMKRAIDDVGGRIWRHA